ncbi:MAG: cobalt-zinc-cadmium efflux system outer membrane protein [Pirellulaceae bacterium]|jgi:cobalt-zinc-cadmium efflux system outer membrane protein
MAMRTSFPVCLLIVALIAALIGCQSTDHVRHPDYAELVNSVHHSYHSPLSAVEAIAPESPQFEGPHSVEEYIQFALLQNPKIHAARKRMEAMAHQVPVAASLPDPTLSLTVQPEPVQTASGQQELILAANQKFHWFGKLETRASVAESQTDVARAQLAAEELATISQVKQAYYELYFVQQAIDVTTAEQRLLGEIRDVANSRYKTGQTSQQDVLRAELEISNVETELIRLRQKLKSVQARLARLLHISPQTAVLATNELPPEQVPQDLDRLQQQAVAARPELHAQLAAIERDQRAVALARLDYKPDVTLGLSWVDVASGGISPVANGRDSVLLSAGVNLPIYQKRLNSSVRSAEAKAVASAREYDSLRDGTLEQVTDLFAQAQSHQELLTLFHEDILPKARQTLQVSSRAYNVGEVDFLQLIDNWRQLLRYEINYRRLDATLRQTLAELERVVGGQEFSGASESSMQPLPALPNE